MKQAQEKKSIVDASEHLSIRDTGGDRAWYVSAFIENALGTRSGVTILCDLPSSNTSYW